MIAASIININCTKQSAKNKTPLMVQVQITDVANIFPKEQVY